MNVTGAVQPMPSSQAASKSASPRTEMAGIGVSSSKPRHVESVAGPARAEDRVMHRIDQTRAKERRPPRVAAAVRRRRAVAERKRRCGDAADDDDNGRSANLATVDPAGEGNVRERVPLDGDGRAFDSQAGRRRRKGWSGGHAFYFIRSHVSVPVTRPSAFLSDSINRLPSSENA